MESDFRKQVLEKLDEIVYLLQRPSESRSSAQVSTSTRGCDLVTKSYADGVLVEATRDAIEQYLIGREALNAASVGDMAATVEKLKASA